MQQQQPLRGSSSASSSPSPPSQPAQFSMSRKRKRALAAAAAAPIDLTADDDEMGSDVEVVEPPTKKAKLEPGAAPAPAASAPAVATSSAVAAVKREAPDYAAMGAKLLLQFPYRGSQWNEAIRSDGWNWNANNAPKTSSREGFVTANTLCASKDCKARKLMRLTEQGWLVKSQFGEHTCEKPAKQRAARVVVSAAAKEDALARFALGQSVQQVYEKQMVDAMNSDDRETALSQVPKPQQLKHLRALQKLSEMTEQDLVAIVRQYGPQGKDAILHFGLVGTTPKDNSPSAPAVSTFNPCWVMITKGMLQRLRNDPNSVVYIDGTFDIVANGLQVCTLAINVKGYAVAAAFLISSGRDTETYVTMLTALRLATGTVWSPRAVVSDFELALQNAFLLVFPNTQVWGCYFHFTQSIRKYLVTQAGRLGSAVQARVPCAHCGPASIRIGNAEEDELAGVR